MNTKKILFSALIAFSILNLSSCKKGDEDPFFSFKSREGRMKGEWELTNVTGESIDIDEKISYSFSNGILTTVSDQDGTTTSEFDIKFEFGKGQKAKFIYYEGSTDPEAPGFYRYTVDGFYNFLGKSKEQDLKKKEAFMLLEQKSTYEEAGDETEVYEQSKSDYGYRFVLIRLTNKEMKISFKYSGFFSKSMPEFESKYEQIWTFKKK